jgi:hypothetical protein
VNQNDIIFYHNDGKSSREIASILGCSKSHVNNIINKYKESAIGRDDFILPNDYKYEQKKRYVITSATNNTPLHIETFKCLELLCKELDAELLVVPIRYKNPTIILNSGQYSVYWPQQLEGRYVSRRLELNDRLTLFGDVIVQATTILPLSGLSSLPNRKHAIFGHPILQLETYANIVGKQAKMSLTTGSVSVPSYSNTKQGHKAKELHHLGAILVELDEKEKLFFAYQLSYSHKSKSIIHLDKEYFYNGQVEKAKPATALTIGDTHVGDHSVEVHEGVIKLNKDLQVQNNHWHDFFNGKAVNHHIKNNLIAKYQSFITNKSNLAKEIDEVYDFIKKYLDPNITHHFIESNHNSWVDRWLSNPSSNLDIENLHLYHKLNYIILDNFLKNRKEVLTGFGAIINEFIENNPEYKNKLHVLDGETPLVYNDTYYDQHGHQGVGGSKGSPAQFANLQFKTVIGHTHSAFIRGKAFGAGTGTKFKVGYNKALTRWTQTSIIEYSNGTKTLIHFIGSRYKL